MGGIDPHGAAAAAPAHDAEASRIAVRCRDHPGRGRVEIGDPLGVWRLRDHLADDCLRVRHLRKIALAGVKLRRHHTIAGLCEATADILDVSVDAEDLLDHEDDRKRTAPLRHRPIARHRPVDGRDADLAGFDARVVGGDDLSLHRSRRQSQAGHQARHDETAPGERRNQQALIAGKLIEPDPARVVALHDTLVPVLAMEGSSGITTVN